ncbi:MAG: hypothetical protein KatS3mg035_0229 [Bacteroidia bacterium]|nr:MAG: hypothetical protein KatS3mg035_0229 [Bacteroidia bacterium]
MTLKGLPQSINNFFTDNQKLLKEPNKFIEKLFIDLLDKYNLSSNTETDQENITQPSIINPKIVFNPKFYIIWQTEKQLQTALQKPYDRILFAKDVLSPVLGSCLNINTRPVPVSVQLNISEQAIIQSVSIYGTIYLEDGTEIACYEIVLQPSVRIEHNKVAIQRYVRKLLIAGQMALVNFIAPQKQKRLAFDSGCPKTAY